MKLSLSQYEAFSKDMGLEFDHGNYYIFDAGYLAQKIVGHDKEIICDVHIEVNKKDNCVEILDFGLISDGIEFDEDIILINEKVVNLISEYKVL
jgi:hypothetical protein